VTAETVDSGP